MTTTAWTGHCVEYWAPGFLRCICAGPKFSKKDKKQGKKDSRKDKITQKRKMSPKKCSKKEVY